jgi:hypothetical protein
MTNRQAINRRRRLLAAAVGAALPVLAAVASVDAQTRVNQDGRALDANTRVGGDGSNDARNGIDRRGQTYTGNQIVTGNVSGARAFRGTVNYRDPNEFTGRVSSFNSDRFVRDSSGAPTRGGGNAMTDYGRPTAFYNDTRSTPPPPGYRPEGFTGGYYNTGASQQTLGRNPYEQSTSRVYTSQSSMLRPGDLLLQQAGQDNQQPTMLSASPLYGVMPLNPTLLNNQGPGGTMNAPGAAGAANDPRNPANTFRLTPAEIERMRRELNERGQEGAQDGQADPNNLAQPLEAQALQNELGAGASEGVQSGRAAAIQGRNRGGATAATAGQPGQPAAAPGTVQGQLSADRLSGADSRTQQGLQRQLTIPPAKQSKQFAELQNRLQQQMQVGGAQGDAEAQRQLRQMRRAQDEGAGATEAVPPGQPGAAAQPRPMLPPAPRKGGAAPAAPAGKPAAPAPKPAAPAKPDAAVEPATPAEAAPAPAATERPAPLRIKSLAEGVEAPGLRDLLKGAETEMKAGNYRSALEKYAAAEQVAPNNPLIQLGRAHTLLADTKYGSAEASLRQAVLTNPELLMGQYDLDAFIGRERLGFLVKDLQQIAQTEAASPRPLLLQAYIAYNTPGLEGATAQHLDAAAERTGKSDPLIEAMRKHWNLSGGEAAPVPEAPAATETPAAPEAKPDEAKPEDANK